MVSRMAVDSLILKPPTVDASRTYGASKRKSYLSAFKSDTEIGARLHTRVNLSIEGHHLDTQRALTLVSK